jgi:preprotein translocase subunit SecE
VQWWHRLRRFLQDVRDELRRVTWPSRPSVVEHTILVLLTVAAIGFVLWLVDLGGQWVLHELFRRLLG